MMRIEHWTGSPVLDNRYTQIPLKKRRWSDHNGNITCKKWKIYSNENSSIQPKKKMKKTMYGSHKDDYDELTDFYETLYECHANRSYSLFTVFSSLPLTI
jgi:NAD+--asparagine ADP-ribosyltransferase